VGPRREPERTCVGCRERAPQRSLLRIVRAPEGAVRVDAAGTALGRGAYVHRDAGCVRGALARGALARALRTGLEPEEAARLGRDIEGELQG
jgi:hypothetical protein